MHILLYLLFFAATVLMQPSYKISQSGIKKMIPGDVGIVFYINIKNLCRKKYHIHVKMLKCVEMFSNQEENTEDMYLIGGYMGVLYKKSYMKTTLIYPNLYPYNRQGSCTIGIYSTDENYRTFETAVTIPFGTESCEDNTPTGIEEYYNVRKVKSCETTDLDPFDDCRPVDCMMKYMGNRNYFHDTWKRCQKIPRCVSDPHKEEPDVAYIPTSNRCRNLNSCVTTSDINLLEAGIVTNSTKNLLSSRGLLVRCNNGNFDNSTGICACLTGWTSAEEDTEKYVPGLSVYHMCNIKINSWNAANKAEIRHIVLAFAVLTILITMVILLLIFCLYCLYAYMKVSEKSPFERSPYDDGSDIQVNINAFEKSQCPPSCNKSI